SFQRPTSAQNGPRRLKRVKALHWQTPARGSFDPQRFSGALANRLTALLGGGGKFGDQPNGPTAVTCVSCVGFSLRAQRGTGSPLASPRTTATTALPGSSLRWARA